MKSSWTPDVHRHINLKPMPYRKQQFVNYEIYHIIVRALDDNLIFKNTDDYYRGIFSIYEFNTSESVTIQRRREERAYFKKISENLVPTLIRGHRVSTDSEPADLRDKFLDVVSFCFMPNHIHLLLRQLKENGISKFMQKVGVGYGKYFNGKYERKGHVFQDTFKAVHIKDDNQFKTVVPYIFTNPTALIEPGWKELGIRNHSTEEVVKFLKEYKWSSYQDCIGIKNFPSVTERKFLLEIMGGEQGLNGAVGNWITRKKDIGQFSDLFLE